ncbi:uncharacterized protein LOC131882300 [Tigriopus californicus]|uniref:uncharacterized protein LOC131882300 n=1 Tax=Tigriopus californicus TaxID=6832 RepID=UPI0027DA76B8|nr:uncharacterized protein LOC131882300 [Tigriopus californicus]
MVRLSDGRIWIYYYSKPYSVLFDGDTFLPFMEPIWTNNGYSLMKPTMARVFEDNIVAVGGVLFHFESNSPSMSRATKVFILDMKKNESRAVEDIPGDFLLFPSIWPVVVDGQRKVFIAKGTNRRRQPNRKLYILDWKTEKFSVLDNSAPYFPTPDGGYQFKGMSMLGQEPYYLQGNASGVGIYNLQDLADGQSGDTKTIYIPGATNVHDLQLADVDDWLED